MFLIDLYILLIQIDAVSYSVYEKILNICFFFSYQKIVLFPKITLANLKNRY